VKRTRLRRQGPRGRARAARLAALRPTVLAKWGKRCANPDCQKGGNLDLHHVTKRSQGGPDTLANLVPLCRPCHDATDYASGTWRKLVIEPYRDGMDWVSWAPGATLTRGLIFRWT
jgi:5-methylcytosine-specific restriction endonuclease McrA